MSEREGDGGARCDAEWRVRETGCGEALLRKLEVVQSCLFSFFLRVQIEVG